MTAAAAVDGIREVDATGSIGIVSAEPDAPYNRPPLSKGLWKGEPLDGIWRKTKGKAPELHLGRVIKEIVPKEKRVIDNNGNVFTYEKLLLATGGTASSSSVRRRSNNLFPHPRRLPAPSRAERKGRSLRRHWRRVHRERNRRGSRHEWEESHNDFSRPRCWRTSLPARSGSLCLRHLQAKRSRAGAGRKGRCFRSTRRSTRAQNGFREDDRSRCAWWRASGSSRISSLPSRLA